MHEHDTTGTACRCGWYPGRPKLDFIQSIMNIKTNGVQIVKNGKLADGYHVIYGVEYLVLTVLATP